MKIKYNLLRKEYTLAIKERQPSRKEYKLCYWITYLGQVSERVAV